MEKGKRDGATEMSNWVGQANCPLLVLLSDIKASDLIKMHLIKKSRRVEDRWAVFTRNLATDSDLESHQDGTEDADNTYNNW